jgi:hypothetical protein
VKNITYNGKTYTGGWQITLSNVTAADVNVYCKQVQ